jgi:GTP-binding protein HflX
VFEAQMLAVEQLLERLEFSRIPTIRVFNKIDLIDPNTLENICSRYGGIGISAVDSKTFPPLIHRMEDEILETLAEREESIPEADELVSHWSAN